MNYLEKLENAAGSTGSIICMGLDPVPEYLPGGAPDLKSQIVSFFEKLFTEMKRLEVLPGAFKPNIGFYHCLDKPRQGDYRGSEALAGILEMIDTLFPGIPVILDYKRGDIARSSENYAYEGFNAWGCHAVTAAPYMGSDSIIPFLQQAFEAGGGTYILNRTSNKGAAEFQNLRIEGEGKPLYIKTAEKIAGWAKQYPGTGAVVGATSLEELKILSRFYAHVHAPLLIPGVGGQGGSAAGTVAVLKDCAYSLPIARINSSSGITHPWARENRPCPKDWTGICIEALKKLNSEVGKLT